MRKSYIFIVGMFIHSANVNAGALESWDSSVAGVRTCSHPTTAATIIQIDFQNGKSLALADNDYPDKLFANYMSVALTAYTAKKKLHVYDANTYSANYCGVVNSTHSAGAVDLRIHD